MARPAQPSDAAQGLAPGMSYFTVLEPTKILGPDGEPQYQVTGPFVSLDQASQFGVTRPGGALISATLILHQYAAAVPKARAAVKA